MASKVQRRIRTTLVVLVLAVVLLIGFFAYQQRQIILDSIAANNFAPSQAIIDLTESVDLTDEGERIFLASKPTLDSSQLFNEQCSQVSHAEGGHVLGCYVSGQIHLFQVTDERLDGIVQATAVHELLHATFARMDDVEREYVVNLLNDTYAELAETDPELVVRMSVYDELSEIAYANELHSVLATEVRVLPEALDVHYAQWLADRALIVDYFDASHHVFVELQSRAADIELELTQLREDVERRNAIYDAAVDQFNKDIALFSERNQNFEFSGDPDRFYAERDALDARRAALNAEMESLNESIAYYETLRSELQQLGELNSELQNQLNSELAPPSSSPSDTVA